MRCAFLLSSLTGVLALGLFAAAAEPTGDLDELHQLVADKHYPQAMQKITAGLALKGRAAQNVDRCELFMLKGECHLRTRALSMALDAYANAAKEADAVADYRRSTLAHAHVALLKASKGFVYTPKVGVDKTKTAAIDILDPASRRLAFLALFMDELAANDAALKAAKSAKSLPPIAQLAKPLQEMEGLELAARENSGEAEKVNALRKDLGESARKMLAQALHDLSKRVGEIDKDAGTFIESYQEVADPLSAVPRFRKERIYRKKGLTDAQTKELQETITTCDKLPPALDDLAAGLKLDDKTLSPYSDEAGRIRKEIDRILDTDYLKIYREIPKK